MKEYCSYDRDGKEMPWDWWRDKTLRDSYATSQRVACTEINGNHNQYTVSTVWLSGIDHNWGGGPPIIFETMIFGGDYDQELRRYSTEEAAIRGHIDAVDRLRAGKEPF